MYTGMAHMKFESRILACLKFESWISGLFRGLNPESLTPSSRALDSDWLGLDRRVRASPFISKVSPTWASPLLAHGDVKRTMPTVGQGFSRGGGDRKTGATIKCKHLPATWCSPSKLHSPTLWFQWKVAKRKCYIKLSGVTVCFLVDKSAVCDTKDNPADNQIQPRVLGNLWVSNRHAN